MTMRVNKKLLIKYSLDVLPLALLVYVYLVYQQKMNDLAVRKQEQSLGSLMKLLLVYIILSGVMILSNFLTYMRVTAGHMNMAYRRNYAALETLLVLAHIILGLVIIIMSAVGFGKLDETEKDNDTTLMFGMVWASVGASVVLDLADLAI